MKNDKLGVKTWEFTLGAASVALLRTIASLLWPRPHSDFYFSAVEAVALSAVLSVVWAFVGALWVSLVMRFDEVGYGRVMSFVAGLLFYVTLAVPAFWLPIGGVGGGFFFAHFFILFPALLLLIDRLPIRALRVRMNTKVR